MQTASSAGQLDELSEGLGVTIERDVVAVYRQLIAEHSPRSIVVGGTSAGGGLALASVHKFLALGLETPGAIYAGTPWADLTKTGDTRVFAELGAFLEQHLP